MWGEGGMVVHKNWLPTLLSCFAYIVNKGFHVIMRWNPWRNRAPKADFKSTLALETSYKTSILSASILIRQLNSGLSKQNGRKLFGRVFAHFFPPSTLTDVDCTVEKELLLRMFFIFQIRNLNVLLLSQLWILAGISM